MPCIVNRVRFLTIGRSGIEREREMYSKIKNGLVRINSLPFTRISRWNVDNEKGRSREKISSYGAAET